MAFAKLRATGELSDISVTVEGETLRLHKFPLVARSEYFKGLINSKMADSSSVTLHDFPGGLETMSLVADFSYNIDIKPKISCENVGPLICAASYLQMTDADNLLDVAKKIFNHLSSRNALNCLQILKGCGNAPANAEAEGIVEECVTTLSSHWTKSGFTSNMISMNETAILQQLPLKWMPTLLEKLKQNRSHPEVKAKVIMAAVSWSQANDKELLESYTVVESDAVDSECKDAATTDLITVFDAIVKHIPHPSSLESTGVQRVVLHSEYPPSRCLWYCKALLFASQHKLLISCSNLLQCCSFLESCLTVDHCKDFPPDLMESMNMSSYDALHNEDQDKRICSLNFGYLLQHCKQGSINARGFLAVTSSVKQFRGCSSFVDRAFEAFEALLGSSQGSFLCPEDIRKISDSIDFSKLGGKFLQRAASNDRIPKGTILSGVMQLCERLRSNLDKRHADFQKLKAHDEQTEMKLDKELLRVRSLREQLEEQNQIICTWRQGDGRLRQMIERNESEISKLKEELMRARKELEKKDQIICNWEQSHKSLRQKLEEKSFEISTLKEDICRLTGRSKTLEKESTILREGEDKLVTTKATDARLSRGLAIAQQLSSPQGRRLRPGRPGSSRANVFQIKKYF
ncbi:uncharacterized protein [Oscarella lobularis]|uniref:uncharacterized protein n=1 Tax=Oscarella lobularis TaxID=121494 RepID=UPI0033138E31